MTDFFVPLVAVAMVVDDGHVPECVFTRGRWRLLTVSLLAGSAAVLLMTWHPLFHRCPQGAAAAGGPGCHPAAGRREQGGLADAAVFSQ